MAIVRLTADLQRLLLHRWSYSRMGAFGNVTMRFSCRQQQDAPPGSYRNSEIDTI